jgi:hypothetical protein
MNIVAHLTPCTPNSTVASARVAKFIVNTLNNIENGEEFALIDTLPKAEEFLTVSDVIGTLFIVNGPMAFCDFLEPLAKMVKMANRVVFVQQDYSIMPPSANSKAESPFRKVFVELNLRPDFWTTVKKNIQTPEDKYINWNQLTYDPQPLPSLSETRCLMYYGAYREKRVPMFEKYFVETPYIVNVSTTTLRGKKFKELDNRINIVPPFTGLGNMPRCSCSIYIEDPLSSKEFHSPANRFYELLSAGIPFFFDRASLPMLELAGINVPGLWVVNNKEQLYRKMYEVDMDAMRKEQRLLWDKPYVATLQQMLLQSWKLHQLEFKQVKEAA